MRESVRPAGRAALGEEPRFWDPSLGQKGLSLRRLGWGRVVAEDPRWGETKCVSSGVPTGDVNPAHSHWFWEGTPPP